MPIYERMTIRGRGGALPTYQSQQAPYVPGQGVTARLSDSRAEIEAAGNEARMKAVAGLGKAVKGAIDVGLQAADDYAKTKATELVTKYKTAMRQSLYGDGGILTREGESAFTANADTMKRSKELRAELLHGMAGSLVAQKFNMVIDPEEAEYSLKAQEYEGKQYRVYQDRTDAAAFNEAAESAMYGYADANTFAKGTGQALWFQEQMLRRKGYTGEALERGLKESSSKIFAGGIEQALAGNDLVSARRLLKQGEGSRMTAEDAAKARKAIDAKAEALEKRMEKAQKEAEAAKFEQDVATQSAEILKQVNEFPDAEVRTAKAVELTKDIEDAKLKAAVRKAIDGTLKEQELQSKARLVLELDSLDSLISSTRPGGTGYTVTDKLAVIQQADVSEEAKRVATKNVYDQLDGKNNEAASASGLAAWRQWFDATGGRASQEEMQAKMLDFGLSAADRKKAADYKGVRLEYPQQRVFSLIDSVFGKGKKNDAEKARMYEAIVTQAKASGKTMSDKELKALIYQQDAEGYIAGGEKAWWGGVDTMTYTEAMEKTGGRMGLFRPELSEDTAKQYRAKLEVLQPWSVHLDKAGRDLLAQVTYLQEQMGIQLELTADERKKFEAAMNKYNTGAR